MLGAWCGTSAFPEGAFAEGCDPSERVPERWRIDAGGCIPPAALVKLIAEYDSQTFNMGFIASFWDDRIEAMFELKTMKWGLDILRRKNMCDMMGFWLVMSH